MMANKAHKHPVITIIPVSKTVNTLTYVMMMTPNGAEHTFEAVTTDCRWIISKLKIGESYKVYQHIVHGNRTAWYKFEETTVGGAYATVNPIEAKVKEMKRLKAQREAVNKNLSELLGF